MTRIDGVRLVYKFNWSKIPKEMRPFGVWEEKTGNPSVSTKLQIRAGQCAWYPKPILLTVSSRSSGGPCNLTWHLNKKTRSHVVFRSLCWKLNSSPCVRFRFCLNMQRNYFVYIYIWRFNIYLLIYCTYEIHYELLIIAVPINFYWILYLDIFHLLFLKCVTKRQYSLLKHADKQRLKKKRRMPLLSNKLSI